MFKSINDPLLASQWYLGNTGQRGRTGIDINLSPVWGRFDGTGVVVAVNDDGVDLTHPDLIGNLLFSRVYDPVRDVTGDGFSPSPSPEADAHGTVVAGIIGMIDNNGLGGAGIAHEARIVPARVIGEGLPADASARVIQSNIASGAMVSVNSWGNDAAFGENFGLGGSAEDRSWGQAVTQAFTEGRGGRGMVFVVASGNERGSGADSGLSNWTGNRGTITVAAVDDQGKVTEYSTPGVGVLVSAPGGSGDAAQSDNTGYGILSADVSGVGGYNTTAGIDGDYSYQNVGTSYATPMVGGVVALMLQANPLLGFRDVANILALTARKVDLANPNWVPLQGTSWNLTGQTYSRDYGYGLLDAAAAVRLAEGWMGGTNNAANWLSAGGVASAPPSALPDGTGQSLAVSATISENLVVERVDVTLNMRAAVPSQLAATLVSPAGTRLTLFDGPLSRAPRAEGPDNPWPGAFTIGVAGLLGERSQGTWRVELLDKESGLPAWSANPADGVATFEGLSIKVWGSANPFGGQLVLTDAYTPGRMLAPGDGISIFNAAASTLPVTIDLSGGAGAWWLALSSMTGLLPRDARGGIAADSLTGNELDNLLDGGDGNDTLQGAAGNDTLLGGLGVDEAVYPGARSSYSLRKAGLDWVVTDAAAGSGSDLLKGLERLRFSDGALDLVNPPRTQAPVYARSSDFLFDSVYYRLANASLGASLTPEAAVQHYLTAGAGQQRAPNAWFDATYYANRWADLRALNLDAATLFQHYNLYGVWEGRSAGPKFDSFDGSRYLRDNPDVAAYVDAFVNDFLGSRSNGAIAHYVIYGQAEGRAVYDLAGRVIDLGYTITLG